MPAHDIQSPSEHLPGLNNFWRSSKKEKPFLQLIRRIFWRQCAKVCLELVIQHRLTADIFMHTHNFVSIAVDKNYSREKKCNLSNCNTCMSCTEVNGNSLHARQFEPGSGGECRDELCGFSRDLSKLSRLLCVYTPIAFLAIQSAVRIITCPTITRHGSIAVVPSHGYLH